MVSDRLARSRKSGPGAPEVVHEKFAKELDIEQWMVSGRLARSKKSGPGGPEVVHEKVDKDLKREMNSFRWASQI